jgi:Glu-tRNA(Gln) amidotransferase subunit E-like FAD-binding protein
MKRLLLFFFLIFISCDKSFKAPEPEILLKQSVMEEILYDISLLKAAKSKSYKILKDNNIQADIYIYNKYKIDSITLRENIAYYATKSFKKAKQIEENIGLKFKANKDNLEKRINDSLIVKKKNDSIKLSKKKYIKDLI